MVLISTFFASGATASCPFGFDLVENDNVHRFPAGQNPTINGRAAPKGYYEAFEKLDLQAVKADLKALFVDSKDFFPADYNNYGPLMIRLAWHAAGSYRVRDGRGGADGGRMRFEPERSWADNTNLDKAHTLLEPIKKKYGVGLSWGDLTVLAGDTAIEMMGGPIVGFCGGRIDDDTGFWSERLGPNAEQEAVEPCDVASTPGGICEFGGSIHPGLIYVNPEGPLINGVRRVDPSLSAVNVRETFARMGMNDTETVALVGGGHAFGKAHGACPSGAGPSPMEQPENPWPGLCGEGVLNTATSGFEGPWTTNPTQWDNQYFKNLFDYVWVNTTSPGGPYQWKVDGTSPAAPNADFSGTQDIVMFTADLALANDPDYIPISQKFMNDQAYLDQQFSEAWYKLMSRDMGPVSRCLGDMVPEPRAFQNPLPAPPAELADFDAVADKLNAVISTEKAPLLVRLAWRCAATHRVTDYTGGCNGARIRLAPQKDWDINMGLDQALSFLEPVKTKFGDNLSWADLIVLAGNTALEKLGAPKLPFCGGRTDATEAGSAGVMEPRLNDDLSNTLDDLQETALLLGVSPREFTALMGRRSVGKHNDLGDGFMGMHDDTPMTLDNGYYTALLSGEWMMGSKQYTSGSLSALRSDLLITYDPEFATAAQDFASDNDMFLEEFAAAWTKVMNADRYDGPTGNLCEPYMSPAEMELKNMKTGGKTNTETVLLATVVVLAVLFLLSLMFNLYTWCWSSSSKEDGVEMVLPVRKGSTDSQGQQSPRGKTQV